MAIPFMQQPSKEHGYYLEKELDGGGYTVDQLDQEIAIFKSEIVVKFPVEVDNSAIKVESSYNGLCLEYADTVPNPDYEKEMIKYEAYLIEKRKEEGQIREEHRKFELARDHRKALKASKSNVRFEKRLEEIEKSDNYSLREKMAIIEYLKQMKSGQK